ncbi:MAG: MBL fold metallo-hydrolase [Desulfuromonas sp.]|nr:MBL fold metallo-hydrolase [Desulfuromonas sp.]
MNKSIEIIGAESLGVRSLCCFIQAGERRILIDPGVALGYIRHGLLPHPRQVAEGERVRRRIIEALSAATDVVFSHFHGDHIPLREANPYQLAMRHLPANFQHLRAWGKSADDLGEKMQHRASDLAQLLGQNLHIAEGVSAGPMTFSRAVPHGCKGSQQGTVMMTRIDLGNKVFLHASDIQLLDAETVGFIINWQPDIVLAGGPPLYIEKLTAEQRAAAWRNALHLARNVDTLILDHHLMRDQQGPKWLDNLSAEVGKKVYCAADFMGKKYLLLEAERTELYATMPVPTHWHEEYAQELISAEEWL